MLYISKSQIPQEVAEEISRVRREQGSLLDRQDAQSARIAFDCLKKSLIRSSLVTEQHGLCAYCMRRIKDDEKTTIEHWQPLNSNVNGVLDYRNMLGVCDGGRRTADTSEESHHVLCCDASKGNQKITINPCNLAHMGKIRYSADGRIYTYPPDEVLEHDINEVLHLNGENGIDTSTGLKKGRREVYNSFVRFIDKLVKADKLTRGVIEGKIRQLEGQKIYDEFAGVKLYLLKRKLRQL